MYVIEKTTFYTSWLVKKTRKCNSKRRGGSDVSRFGILCFLPFLGLISGKSYSAKMSYVINVVVLLVVTVVGCALNILFPSNHNIHKKFLWPLFLGFRPFIWKIFVKYINQWVWSPKTKAMQTYMNVLIWRKIISSVPIPGKYTFFSLKYKCTCEIFHT